MEVAEHGHRRPQAVLGPQGDPRRPPEPLPLEVLRLQAIRQGGPGAYRTGRTWNQTAATCRETPQSIARCTGYPGSYSAASLTWRDASNDANHAPSLTSSSSASSSCCPRRVPSYLPTIRSKNDDARCARFS